MFLIEPLIEPLKQNLSYSKKAYRFMDLVFSLTKYGLERKIKKWIGSNMIDMFTKLNSKQVGLLITQCFFLIQ